MHIYIYIYMPKKEDKNLFEYLKCSVNRIYIYI